MLRRRALREQGSAGARTSSRWARWQDGLHPVVRAEAEARVAGGLPLHDHARALHSSQMFAWNLFLPFASGDREGLAGLVSESLGREVCVTGIDLEWFGSGDLLAEIPHATPGPDDRYTQADVAIHLRDHENRTGLLLIEVKLTEGGFTPCGGAESRGNRDRRPCEDAGVFLDEPHRCYLRRPVRATRARRYWTRFAGRHGDLASAFPGVDREGACPFRGDGQQPMRNHALALAAQQMGYADFWALALVHHDHNPDVPAPWDRYVSWTSDAAHLHRWPASRLLPAIAQAHPRQAPRLGAWLTDRYALGDLP